MLFRSQTKMTIYNLPANKLGQLAGAPQAPMGVKAGATAVVVESPADKHAGRSARADPCGRALRGFRALRRTGNAMGSHSVIEHALEIRFEITLDGKHRVRFEQECAAREKEPASLMADLFEIIVKDDLFEAVLGD